MKRFLLIITVLMATLGARAQGDKLFPYPTAPESLPFGRARANYIVEHFWDNCPWKRAYSSVNAMQGAMRDFADFLPHAAADTVFRSIDKLITESSRRPDDLAALLRIAEATFGSDTAYLRSDQVFLPFARAGAEARKFSSQQRAAYAAKVLRIENSAEGAILPPLKATRRDGSTFALNDTVPGTVTYVIILEDPADATARFERLRFSSNYAVSTLVDAGIVRPLLIATATPTDAWWDAAATLPKGWAAGAMTDAAALLDLGGSPTVYVLDSDMRIERKLMPLPALTANCEAIITNLNRPQ